MSNGLSILYLQEMPLRKLPSWWQLYSIPKWERCVQNICVWKLQVQCFYRVNKSALCLSQQVILQVPWASGVPSWIHEQFLVVWTGEQIIIICCSAENKWIGFFTVIHPVITKAIKTQKDEIFTHLLTKGCTIHCCLLDLSACLRPPVLSFHLACLSAIWHRS